MGMDLFSERHGRARPLDQGDFANLVWWGIADLKKKGYFAEALDEHEQPPSILRRPRIEQAQAEFLRVLKVDDVYGQLTGGDAGYTSGSAPVSWQFHSDVLWDSLEYLYQHVISEPQTDGTYSREAGQTAFRATVTRDLAHYRPPMELTPTGHVVERAPDELQPLLNDPVPDEVPSPLRDPLRAAIDQYRRRGASVHDKRSALKHLADVLEPLRNEIDENLLPADENALFQIANKFHIRHNSRTEQRNYDTAVWLDWMFYVYVATARALLSVLDRQDLAESVFGPPPDAEGGLPL